VVCALVRLPQTRQGVGQMQAVAKCVVGFAVVEFVIARGNATATRMGQICTIDDASLRLP